MKSCTEKIVERYQAGDNTTAMQLSTRLSPEKIARAFMERGKSRSQANDIAHFLKSKNRQ